MSKCADEFITKVLKQIKYKKIHSTISEELNSHIYELAGNYMDEGMEEEQAYEKAIARMGNPVEIGEKLHKTHKPKTEWSIMGILVVLVIFGLYTILVYSAYVNDYTYFNKQLLFMGIGIAVLISCYYFDYTKLEGYCFFGYIAACLVLLLTIMYGPKRNGRAYIVTLGFSIRASSAVIPFLLLSYSGFIKRWCDGRLLNIIKLLALAVIPLFFILMEPSMAYFLIVGAGLIIMLTLGICGKDFIGDRKKTLLILYGSSIAAIALFYRTILYERIAVFFNPYNDSLDQGWLLVQVDKIKNSASLLGAGSYFKNRSESLLPGTDSEFIFTFIVGKLGWLTGIILIGLFAAIMIRLFIASWKVRDTFGKYLCLGICCVFSLQVIVNILVSMGLFPTCTVSLPFFSYGGGNYILNMALIGLLLGVYRRKDIILEK